MTIATRVLLSSSLTALVFVYSPALAQDTAPTRQSASSGIETVEVTASKQAKAVNVQRVPIAMSVTTHDDLVAAALTNITQVGYRVPNVQLEPAAQGPGLANFTIRGMGLNTSTEGTDPTVGVLIDGMPLGTAAGAVVDTYDLQDVEILAGPQGVLFGRNTTSGAVLINSMRPSGNTDGEVVLSAGTHVQYGAAGFFEAPIVDDVLAFRVAAQYNHQGDLYGNDVNHNAGGPHYETTMIRPTFKYTPTANIDFTLVAEHYEYHGTGETTQSGGPGIDPSLVGGDDVLAVTAFGVPVCQHKDKLCLATPSHAYFDTDRISGELNWHFGSGVLTSITGYRNYTFRSGNNDSDGTAAPVFTITPVNVSQHQFSEEVRYAGDAFDSKFHYTLGGFYFNQELEQQSLRTIHTSPASTSLQGNDAVQRQWSAAFFHDFSYDITSDLTVSFGGRFTHEEKTNDIASYSKNQCANPAGLFDKAFCNFDTKGAHFKSDTYGPQAGAQWTPKKDLMFYAKYGIAYRSGGFNNANKLPAPGDLPYHDEKVAATEIGMKAEWFDERLLTNFSLFHNKYTDLQRAVTIGTPDGPATAIVNAAAATMQGVEGTFTALITDNLQLNGNFGYLDSKYDQFNDLDLTGDGTPDPELAKKLRLELAPKWTYSIGATYTTTVDLGTLAANINYSHTGSVPSDTTNSSIIGGYGLLDASISLTLGNGQVVSIYGHNLTNTIHSAQTVVSPPVLVLRSLADPRTIGISYRIPF